MSLIPTLLINSSRYLLMLIVIIAICLVLLAFFGTQSAVNIDSKRDVIEKLIADASGLPINLGFLSAEWTGATPVIGVERLEVGSSSDGLAAVINDARADLDIYKSLRHLSLIWKNFSIDRATINLQQDAIGSWRLRGFSGHDAGGLSAVISLVVFSRLVELKTLNLDLHFNDGNKLTLVASEVNFENEGEFHRAELTFTIESQEKTNYLIIEGRGDPTDLEAFYATGYIKIEGLKLDDILLDTTETILPTIYKSTALEQATADSEIWFDVHPGGATDFHGGIIVGVQKLSDSITSPTTQNIKADITAWYTPKVNWGFRMQQLALSRNENHTKPINVQFSKYSDSQEKDFEIIVDTLQIDAALQIAREFVIEDHWIPEFIQKLELDGYLRNVHLGMGVDGFFGAAELRDFDSLAYGVVPGVRDLDAVIKVIGGQAALTLNDNNGAEIHFARVYDEPLDLHSLNGRLNFFVTSERDVMKINSNLIDVELDAGTVSAMFSLRTELPISDGAPDMNILIGGRNIDARFREKYFPKKIPSDLKNWLQKSIISAEVEELGLAFRRGAPKFTPIAGTNQLSFKVDNAAIDFHPEWDNARDLSGIAVLDDKYFLAEVDSGLLGAIDLVHGGIEFDRTQGVGSRIQVEADLSSSILDAMQALSSSPLNKSMGSLSDWHYKGSQSSTLFLDIPIRKRTDDQADDSDAIYSANIGLRDGEIHLPDSRIAVTEIFGDLVFESNRGLLAEDVVGLFWGRPISARFYPEKEHQMVDLETHIEPKKLNQLVDFPWHEVLGGNIPVSGSLRIPRRSGAFNQTSVLELNSNLEGVEIILPDPFGKSAERSIKANLTIDMDSQLKSISGQVEKDLKLDIRFQEGVLDRGLLAFKRNVEVPEKGIFLLAGHFPTADFKMWKPFIPIFDHSAQEKIEGTATGESKKNRWEPYLDLTFDYLTPFKTRLNNVSAQIGRKQKGITVSFQSDIADGKFVHFRSEDQVPRLNLSRLAISKDWLSENESPTVLDPRVFPNLDIDIDQLFVEDELWGGIGFNLRSEISGAAFGDITGNLFGFKLGSDSQNPPTEFFWHFDGEFHSSRLVGPMRLTDLGDVFKSLNLPRIADSESGNIIFDLNWPDKPWSFSRDNIRGDFKFEFFSGSLYKSSPSADLALRMISLVNFANWLKRLQLDFSDVLDQNLPYDSLNGTFSFSAGLAQLDEPLHMKMPSGKMTMAGEFDLVNETMEGKLVATLPVATNLPWVAAVVGGLPAAAGVYLTSKLVEEQVDRLSSISYKLTGDWDDIEVKVDQIFAESLETDGDINKAPN